MSGTGPVLNNGNYYYCDYQKAWNMFSLFFEFNIKIIRMCVYVCVCVYTHIYMTKNPWESTLKVIIKLTWFRWFESNGDSGETDIIYKQIFML